MYNMVELKKFYLDKVKSAHSCPTLCDCIVHETLEARILELAAFPSPGDLPNPRIEPWSPTLQADSLPPKPQGKPVHTNTYIRTK